MNQTLHHHILYLEDALQRLSRSLTDPSIQPAERASLEKKISVIESALSHYRQAFELEHQIRVGEDSAGL